MNWTEFTEISIGLIIFGVFAFAFLIQLWYYLFFFSRVSFYKKKELPAFTPPASIIICARNEDHNPYEPHSQRRCHRRGLRYC